MRQTITLLAVLGAALAGFFVKYPYALVLTWGALGMFGDIRLEMLGGQSLFGALTYLSLPCFLIVAAPIHVRTPCHRSAERWSRLDHRAGYCQERRV